MIKESEITHLGSLARIKLTPEEVAAFGEEITAIVAYVGAVSDIAGDEEEVKQVGAVHNVFRADEPTNTPGQYTDAVLAQMPDTEGKYLKVKKILSQD